MKPIIAVSSLSQTKSPPYTRAGGVILWAMETPSLSIAFSMRNGSATFIPFAIMALFRLIDEFTTDKSGKVSYKYGLKIRIN
jgi:hypothetical protein